MNQLRSWLYGDNATKKPEIGCPSTLQDKDNKKLTRHFQYERERGEHKKWLSFIPLAPGDCLECKLIGTGVMALSGIIIVTSAAAAKKRNANLAGLQGAVYLILCGAMFAGFETMAACRLLDLGPFKKTASHNASETRR